MTRRAPPAGHHSSVALQNCVIGHRRGRAIPCGSLSFVHPQVVGVIGPNGSGKSTLLATLAGLLTPRQGTIVISGTPLADLSPERRAQVLSWLPQTGEAALSFTGSEVVLMGRFPWHHGRPGPSDLQAAHAIMEALSCESLAAMPVSRMSGGQRQRIMLARALVGEHPIVLLDEPDIHLDLPTLDRLHTWLGQARTRRLIVMALHDLNRAARWCDRVVLFGGEGVVTHGEVGQVIQADNLRAAFGVAARVHELPDGERIVSFE